MTKNNFSKRGSVVIAGGVSYTARRDTNEVPPGADWLPSVIEDDAWKFPEAIPGERGPRGERGDPSMVPGPKGEPGKSLVPRGQYKRTTAYSVNDVVSHEGSSYVCIKDAKGRSPEIAKDVWLLLAKAGSDGRPGKNAETIVVRGGGARLPLIHDLQERVAELEANGGTGGSELLPLIFDSNAVKGLALYASADGHCELAQADSESTSGVIGLANANTTAGAAGNVNCDGIVELDDWSSVLEGGGATLSTGAVYYLSATEAGKMTAVAPTTIGHRVVLLGRAASATQFAIEIDRAILL